MLLVVNLTQYDAKKLKTTESLTKRCSSESTQGELSNEYQNDRVKMVFKNICIHMLWTKVASALEWLKLAMHLKIIDVLACNISWMSSNSGWQKASMGCKSNAKGMSFLVNPSNATYVLSINTFVVT